MQLFLIKIRKIIKKIIHSVGLENTPRLSQSKVHFRVTMTLEEKTKMPNKTIQKISKKKKEDDLFFQAFMAVF